MKRELQSVRFKRSILIKFSPFGCELDTVLMYFKKYCEKVGLDDKFETTGRMKINLYCFRAYFFTHALDALAESKDMAHALVGHGAYLQQYQRRTLSEKIDMWDKIEDEILVYDLNKKNHKIKKLEEANKRLKDQNEKIDNLEKTAADLAEKVRENQSKGDMTDDIKKYVEKIVLENLDKK